MKGKSLIEAVIDRIRVHGSFSHAIDEVKSGEVTGKYIEGQDYYVEGPERGELCPKKAKKPLAESS